MSTPADLAVAQRQAARVAARADIRDVRLMSTCAEITELPGADTVLTYDLSSEADVEYEPGSQSFVVRGRYRLAIAPAGQANRADAPSAEPIASLTFEQAALFLLSADEGDDEPPPSAEELTAYAVTTGQFALHPYAREYIYDVTGRLGLPPLTVGVLTMPWTETG